MQQWHFMNKRESFIYHRWTFENRKLEIYEETSPMNISIKEFLIFTDCLLYS